MAIDIVQPLKFERTSMGGLTNSQVPEVIDPQNQSLDVGGIVINDATHHDQTTQIDRDDNNMLFQDGNNTLPVTLTQLLSSGGGGGVMQIASSDQSADVTTTSTTWTQLGTVTFSFTKLKAAGVSDLVIYATAALSNGTSAQRVFLRALVDSTPTRAQSGIVSGSGTTTPAPESLDVLTRLTGLAAGAHTITLQWRVSSGTGYCRPASQADYESATLLVEEVQTVASAMTPTLANQVVTASDTLTTTSTTAILTSGMTLTPAAGVYLCFFTGGCWVTTASTTQHATLYIYAGGAAIPGAQVDDGDSTGFCQPFSVVGIATVNGSQAIEGRWSVIAAAGTATMSGPRTLTIVKIG